MKVYEKVAWLQFNNSDFSLRKVFGKEKLKYIEQAQSMFSNQDFSYGVEPLTHENLESFSILYQKYISTKHNPNIHDLKSIYADRIDAGEQIYLWYLRKGSRLLWWWIFIHKILHGEDSLVLWFRAFESDIFNRLSVWYYIEYLYFKFWQELNVAIFSRGADRNGYWLFGSNVWLPIHKVQLYFFPFVHETHKDLLDIEQSVILDDTIFFSQSDSNLSYFDIVDVWTKLSPQEASNKYWIFEKRWLFINYFYI